MDKELFKTRILQQIRDEDSPIRCFMTMPIPQRYITPETDNLAINTDLYATEFNLACWIQKIRVDGQSSFQCIFTEMDIPKEEYVTLYRHDLSGDWYKKMRYAFEEIRFENEFIRFIVRDFTLDAKDYLFERVDEHIREHAVFNLTTCRFEQEDSVQRVLYHMKGAVDYLHDRTNIFYVYHQKQEQELLQALQRNSVGQARADAIRDVFERQRPSSKLSRMMQIIFALQRVAHMPAE